MQKFDLSIVVPFYNEEINIIQTYDEIINTFKDLNKYSYEIIFIDDGSNDNSFLYFDKLKNKENIKIIKNSSNKGQSYSISLGVKESKSKTIITLDGDCQNNPSDIPRLIDIYFNNDFSLVGGIRNKRKDSILKIISSKIANSIRNYILKDNCIDTGCSLKIFEREIFLKFPFFTGLHRFLPSLFAGYNKKTFYIPVQHRYRSYGISKYGTFKRLILGIIDLIRVVIIIKKFKRNNHD